jgi:hypothetical protein
VAELKQTWTLLKPFTDRRPNLKKMLKDHWCSFLQSLFYQDGSQNVCDQAFLLRVLRNSHFHQSPPQMTTTKTTTPSAAQAAASSTTTTATTTTTSLPTLSTTTASNQIPGSRNTMQQLQQQQELQQQQRLYLQQRLIAAKELNKLRSRAQASQQYPSSALNTDTTLPSYAMPLSNAPPRSTTTTATIPAASLANSTMGFPSSSSDALWQRSFGPACSSNVAAAAPLAAAGRYPPCSPSIPASHQASGSRQTNGKRMRPESTAPPSAIRIKQEHDAVAIPPPPLPPPAVPSIIAQHQQAPAVAATPVSETQPSNLQEQQLATELSQMGFTDMTEVLNGIRTLLANQQQQQQQQVETLAPTTSNTSQPSSLTAPTSNDQTTVTADEVMMWLIAQREEAAEALKMDAARLHSEMLRKEAAERRQQETQRQYMEASWREWLASERMFANSWLLRHATLQTTWWQPLSQQRGSPKQALIDLLLVEKQARQWYGTVLPYCYFRYTLCQRLLNMQAPLLSRTMPIHVMVQALQEQTQLLKTGMFTLSEQQGGVPRIFLQAENDARRKGLPTAPASLPATSKNGSPVARGKRKNKAKNDDDDDDDVVEIIDSPRASTQLRRQQSSSHDIIEIS